jgi:two-component system, OmpR family, alkaline phosphatase synthesis response regulator PhoP
MAKKILVVDDEKAILELIQRILSRERYNIITAESGNEALNKIYNESPDLVILDVMLPDMDGLQVCRKIRQDPLYKNLPVIILTVRKADTDQIKGLDTGCDEYMTKPFYPKELSLRVRNILRRKPK